MHLPIRRLLLLAVVGASASAYAGPSTLVLMPIADVLGHREMSWYFAGTGRDPSVDKGITWGHGVTAGFFDRFEFGYDNDLRGTTTVDAKALLFEVPKKFALSAGVRNFDLAHGATDRYVVARFDLPGFRLHVGEDWSDMARTMVGADFALPHGLTGVVENIGGEHGYTSFGFNTPIGKSKWNVTAAVGLPNTNGDGYTYSLTFYVPTKF